MSSSFPVNASELDSTVLSRLLRTVDPNASVEGFTLLDAQTFGDGNVSTAGRAELELTLGNGRLERVIVKLCRPDLPLQPLYRNEVAFYTKVRPELDMEIPTVLGGQFDEASGTFGLAMEDLRLRGATFPSVKTAVSLDQVRALLDTLAAVHARFWQNDDLLGRFAFIAPHIEGELFQFFMAPQAVPALVRTEIENEQFKREMVQAIGTDVGTLYNAVRRVQQHQSRLPFTLCHGDTHIGNTYLLPDGVGGLLDWQLVARGYCMHDVTYLLITALSVTDRRRNEHGLIAYYLERLVSHGVVSPPDADTAWREYCLAANWCLYIGWLTTPITHYGWDITVCNVLRLSAAVADLNSVALAAELPEAPPI